MDQSRFGQWGDALYKGILAARLGRQVLLKYSGRLEHVEKKFQAGLVSEADKESEKAIFDFLRKNFPNDEFVGEESTTDLTKVQGPAGGKGRWIVDPLDGTTNYIHQYPVYAVSIGYEVNGQIQVAVIDVPAFGEVYTAVRGCGAYLNGQPIRVSATEKLEDAFLATGFFTEIESNLSEQLRLFEKVVRQCRGIRRAGAAAYDLCMVARGVFDGYWEKGLKPWDSAAGLLLVEEAGGVMKTYRGDKYTPYKNSMVAGNPKICDEIIKAIGPHIAQDSE
ncbi:MAG: inositol monophosphatase [Oligoflexia bacterium]|nr:MAG: inositol monophosphatase [Oligoflexia bacterium]